MKNLFVLALALVMSCSFAFAQTQTPEQKGKAAAKTLVKALVEEDAEAMEKLGEEMMVLDSVYSEAQAEEYLKGFVEGIYYYCDYYDLGEETADALVNMIRSEIMGDELYY